MRWRTTDSMEESRYGRATDSDTPRCVTCDRPITDDDWVGRPGHMICSRCTKLFAEAVKKGQL